MYFYEQFPFWNAFWKTLGFRLLPSPKTNRIIINEGLDAVVSEPCFPIKVAHRRVRRFKITSTSSFPNVIDGDEFPRLTRIYSWAQTFRSWSALPILDDHEDKLIAHGPFPRAWSKERAHPARQALWGTLRAGARAVEAEAKTGTFKDAMRQAGERVLSQLQESGTLGIVLVGRPAQYHTAALTSMSLEGCATTTESMSCQWTFCRSKRRHPEIQRTY
jgi:hypothetical protein